MQVGREPAGPVLGRVLAPLVVALGAPGDERGEASPRRARAAVAILERAHVVIDGAAGDEGVEIGALEVERSERPVDRTRCDLRLDRGDWREPLVEQRVQLRPDGARLRIPGAGMSASGAMATSSTVRYVHGARWEPTVFCRGKTNDG